MFCTHSRQSLVTSGRQIFSNLWPLQGSVRFYPKGLSTPGSYKSGLEVGPLIIELSMSSMLLV